MFEKDIKVLIVDDMATMRRIIHSRRETMTL